MSSVGSINVSLRGKALAPSQGGQLARNIRENIVDYKENADLAEAAGYGMVYYTPKVKEMDDVQVRVDGDYVVLEFSPKELEKDKDINKLLSFLVEANLKDF